MATASRIIEWMAPGDGTLPKVGDKLLVHYTGCLAHSGRCFDSSRARGHAFTFTVGTGRVIKGWDDLMLTVPKGGRVKLHIPADEAYGSKGSPPSVPPNTDLLFDVELLAINETLVQESVRVRREKEELQRQAADAAFTNTAAVNAARSEAAEAHKRRRGDADAQSGSGCSSDSGSDSSSGARKKSKKKYHKESKRDKESKKSKKDKKDGKKHKKHKSKKSRK
mmetsp:Transcript_11458/g.24535  ORF Transcript_11458/g.24535 Transcript_11458/m.24535 type:complete len:223 (-) Transcript_11458:234-902(-)